MTLTYECDLHNVNMYCTPTMKFLGQDSQKLRAQTGQTDRQTNTTESIITLHSWMDSKYCSSIQVMRKIYKYKMHYMVMRNSAVLDCKLVFTNDRFEEMQKIVIYQSKMYSP